jgi:hypothetical protein
MHTTAANSFNPSSWEEEAVSKHSAHRNRASPELTPKQKLICAWLIQGGVGAHSPKMEELLRRNLDPRAVKAHVLERLACVQGLVQEKPDYAVGLLIRKLEDGDPAPQLRCEQCLELPNRNGLCRCDYADIIKR